MAPVVVRTEVAVKANYADYREELRRDFWFSCAYCSIAETEAQAIGFTIDHYHPQSQPFPGLHDYANLLWTCFTCNRQKGNNWESEAAQEAGYRFVRPDVDDPNEHFLLREDRINVEPLTTSGNYTIEVLNLNRKVLQNVRQLRSRMYYAKVAIVAGLQTLRDISLDRLHPQKRAQFLSASQKAIQQSELVAEELDRASIVRILNGSLVLEPDPAKDSRTKKRREFLAKVHALFPTSIEELPPD